MAIELSGKINRLPRLAVDTANAGFSTTGDFTTLTTVVNETGRFAFENVRLTGATVEDYDFVLTIDGVEKWNFTQAILGANTDIFGTLTGSPLYLVKTSFKLEVKSTTDVSSTVQVGLRKIL